MENLGANEPHAENLPPGWSASYSGERKIYLTPSPKSIKIDCKAKLLEYQRRGRFLDVNVEDLRFGSKRKRKVKSFDYTNEDTGVDVDLTIEKKEVENGLGGKEELEDKVEKEVSEELYGFETLELEDKEVTKLKKEQMNLSESVMKLTKDSSKKLDHKALLEETARKLNELRLKTQHQGALSNSEMEKLKSSLLNCKSEEDIASIVWSAPSVKARLASLNRSRLLEQVLALGFKRENPLNKFPPDLNKNLYKEIIDFALCHSEDLLVTLLTLTVKNESQIDAKDVVKIAYLFATLAESVIADNNVMKKTKSLSLKSCGLTNQGLDSFSVVGASVSSRGYRNDRDFFAGVSEEIAEQ